jgi:chromosome condensin MukBEF ATPase and DNA-binding subunit MukB
VQELAAVLAAEKEKLKKAEKEAKQKKKAAAKEEKELDALKAQIATLQQKKADAVATRAHPIVCRLVLRVVSCLV